MKKFLNIMNKILVFTMIIIGTGLGIYYMTLGSWLRAFSCLSIYLTVLIPFVVRNIFSLSETDKFIYYSFIFLAHLLGSIVNLYSYIAWFDTFTHLLSGIFSFYIGYLFLKKSNVSLTNNFIKFLYFFGVVALVAVMWEIVEFTGDCLFSANYQHNIETGVVDTMIDMIAAICGGFLAYIFYLISGNHKEA